MGLLSHLLLRRRLSRRLHLDVVRALRKSRQQSVLPSSRARNESQGPARARRSPRDGTRVTVRLWSLRLGGGRRPGCFVRKLGRRIDMTHLVPCPNCQRHVRVSETACPFCSTEL